MTSNTPSPRRKPSSRTGTNASPAGVSRPSRQASSSDAATLAGEGWSVMARAGAPPERATAPAAQPVGRVGIEPTTLGLRVVSMAFQPPTFALLSDAQVAQ